MKTYPVRTSAKAIIIHDDKLLVILCSRNNEDFYILPGGGQNHNEGLHATLRRECLEEVGAEVLIHELALVRDYVADNHGFSKVDPGFHQVEFMFRCTIVNPDSLHHQIEPDKHQVGVQWLPLSDLEFLPLYPHAARKSIVELWKGQKTEVYLGDVN